MRSYVQVFPAPQLSGNISETSGAIAASGDIVAIGLAYPNGTSIAPSTSNLPVGQVYPDVALTKALNDQVAVSFFETFFGLFIPLLTIVSVYSIYGKDRVSGVFESVLAQPVTRLGLSLSRYISSFSGMSVATLVSVGVLDIIAQHFSGSFIDPSILIPSTLGLLVELAAFIGIMMLLSHLVRSSGSLIGIGVGLFLVIDFFQGVFATLLSSLLGIQSGSVGFYQLSVGLEFVNPAAFVSLVDTYLTGTISSVGLPILSGQSSSIVPQAYGITVPAIVAAAILWILVPLICFLYMAIRRD
jgi:ABC-type transport system involved in multi-copper enzyme maturation permease subunit